MLVFAVEPVLQCLCTTFPALRKFIFVAENEHSASLANSLCVLCDCCFVFEDIWFPSYFWMVMAASSVSNTELVAWWLELQTYNWMVTGLSLGLEWGEFTKPCYQLTYICCSSNFISWRVTQGFRNGERRRPLNYWKLGKALLIKLISCLKYCNHIQPLQLPSL